MRPEWPAAETQALQPVHDSQFHPQSVNLETLS